MKKLLPALLMAFTIAFNTTSSGLLNLAEEPLYLGAGAPPFVMFLLDDSGSMAWNYMPDTAINLPYYEFYNSNYNYVYYNPSITYVPRINYDGSLQPQGSTRGINAFYYNNNNQLVTITSSSGKQNFANWQTYYQTRIELVQTSIAYAIDAMPASIYAGFWTLHLGEIVPLAPLGPIGSSMRENFFNTLYNIAPNGDTPTRSALQAVGNFYERQTDTLSCRRYYTVLMSDGYWNDDDNFNIGNIDGGGNGPVITGPNNPNYQYVPAAPYADSYSNTLADVAMYYWNRDLRPDLVNNVTTSPSDPAFWQHMVTFTMGLGYPSGFQSGGYPNPWPQPGPNSPNNAYDMWHAAVNSRGQFSSVNTPSDLNNALNTVIDEVTAETASSSSVAINSTSLSANSNAYLASFYSGTWSGDVNAYSLNSTTGVPNLASPLWDAAANMPSATSRIILTQGSGSNAGTAFEWASLSSSQQNTLFNNATGSGTTGTALVSYLRGDPTNEGTSNYHTRTRVGTAASPLADIVDSSPQYVGAPPFNYPSSIASVPYSIFATTYTNREPMIYVGANDGMLHGFDANTGIEKMAYVPGSLLSQLQSYAASTYTHDYYVDGTPTIGDAFISGNWMTVLAGGLGAGGQGLFALNVTNPANFSESSPNSTVLWEFTDANDADLGYTFGRPVIAKMNNGQWAVIMSNGYNSDAPGTHQGSGKAFLYILFIGSSANSTWPSGSYIKLATNSTTSNGLSDPAPLDVNGDNQIDYIYAGDLQGNLWKFDVTNANPSNWGLAKSSGGSTGLLFTTPTVTANGSSRQQPITARPEIGAHPDGGYLVFFGTGRYIDVSDPTTTFLDSFYAIWDNQQTLGITMSSLLSQSILADVGVNSNNARVTTTNPMTWRQTGQTSGGYMGWKIDLVVGSSTPSGERVVTPAVLSDGQVYFTTLTPTSTADCSNGGTISWLMALNALTGSQQTTSAFDYNNNGIINSSDLITYNGSQVAGSGIQSTGTGPTGPTIIQMGNNQSRVLLSAPNGSINSFLTIGNTTTAGRQSWRQLNE